MKIKEILVESDLQEKWSNKYKRSIDCSHPKGFSQRAHCQGRKKKIKEELIFEDQKFDFEGKKPLILQFINGVLSNKLDPTLGHNILYGLIVGDSTKIDAASKLGLSDQFSQSWKKYFQRPEFGGDSAGPWSQIDLGDQFKRTTGDDRTLNFYVTVVKEKNNIAKFLNNIYKLGSYLQPISQKYQTPIKFKTHTLLDIFITHNDSLKVYYYDPKVKDLVVNATRKWLSDSGIVTGTRSHEHGVDLKSGGGSFGEILSNHVYDTFTNLIKTNGTKFTPEQYFEWLKQHLPTLIKQIQQKNINENLDEDSMSLHDWFGKGKHGGAAGGGWDRYNTKGERIGKCGDRKPGEGKPKCLSKARAASLRASGGKKAIASAVRKKRREDPNPEKRGKAEMVSNKTRSKK